MTSRKRETYKVKLEYSLLWECALGIAAITNKPMLKTMEKSYEEWQEMRRNLSRSLSSELEHVEKNNTWKALLQLLHQHSFSDISAFFSYLSKLSDQEFRRVCIPYTGLQFEDVRLKAAQGDTSSMDELKQITKENPFFPKYIEFICVTDVQSLKNHLECVMSGWFEEVIKKDSETISRILKTDYEAKKQMANKMNPEELVEWATGGVTYLPEPSVNQVLLIPQYIYRPWNIEADEKGTKIFYYPVANDSISPADRFTPDHFLVLKHKALGDDVRLRMVKLLNEQDHSLHEMSDKLNLGKSTTHHHLKILRGAKLVEITSSKYSLKKRAVESLSKELDLYLSGKVQ